MMYENLTKYDHFYFINFFIQTNNNITTIKNKIKKIFKYQNVFYVILDEKNDV